MRSLLEQQQDEKLKSDQCLSINASSMNLKHKRYDHQNRRSDEIVNMAELVNMTIFENHEKRSDENEMK